MSNLLYFIWGVHRSKYVDYIS